MEREIPSTQTALHYDLAKSIVKQFAKDSTCQRPSSHRMASGLTWTESYQQHFDPEQGLRDYFTNGSGFTGDSCVQPMQNLHNFFTSDPSLKVDTLIFYGGTYNVHLLFPICDYVKEVIVVYFLNKNMNYLDKWMKNDPEAFNWQKSIKFLNISEEEREQWIKNEGKARKIIRKCVKGDLPESGPVAPQGLTKADCLLSSYCLNYLCKDFDSFIASVKSMSLLLNVGGHLILHVFLNSTFIMVGNFKGSLLYIGEERVKQILTDLGFSIKVVKVNPRNCVSKMSKIDFESILFVVACKENETK